jgi:hypothetical protein
LFPLRDFVRFSSAQIDKTAHGGKVDAGCDRERRHVIRQKPRRGDQNRGRSLRCQFKQGFHCRFPHFVSVIEKSTVKFESSLQTPTPIL